MSDDFADLQKIHHTWGLDVWIKEKHQLDQSVILNESELNSVYFTFAYATADTISPDQLSSIESAFNDISAQPALYINDNQQSHKVTEFLVRNGYKLSSQDAWMLYSSGTKVEKSAGVTVADIDVDSFDDFSSILSVVFADFDQNSRYLDICKKSLVYKPENGMDDFASAFYVIYDNETPASGAGMFYSVKHNFAYLHNAGTLDAFRGKGYQSALIKHRIHLAQSLGISRMYSIVSRGSTSWANMIRCGLDEAQRPIICTKKSATS